MSYIFPPSPTPGTAAVGANGATWVWDGVKWVGGMGGPYLSLAGGDMEGPLYLYADPTIGLEAATKSYVDNIASGLVGPAPMDGQSYGRMLNTWNPVLPITGGIMRGGVNMNGWVLTGLRDPVVPLDAVNKEYVDDLVAGLQVFMGTWQVAANVPDISSPTGLLNGAYYIAVTVDPAVEEIAPAGIPGIGGQSIQNGSMIVWNQAQQIFEIVESGQLTRVQADLLYLALAGGTMTGSLILVGDPFAPLEAATKQYVDNEIADAIANLPPGGGGGGIPEAPADGQSFARRGSTTSWVPVLNAAGVIDGGTF